MTGLDTNVLVRYLTQDDASQVVRLIKPSTVCAASNDLGGHLRRADHDETIQFAYPFEAYFASAMTLGLDAASRRERMPWLKDYGGMKAAF